MPLPRLPAALERQAAAALARDLRTGRFPSDPHRPLPARRAHDHLQRAAAHCHAPSGLQPPVDRDGSGLPGMCCRARAGILARSPHPHPDPRSVHTGERVPRRLHAAPQAGQQHHVPVAAARVPDRVLMNCETMYWSDGDHDSAVGERWFGAGFNLLTALTGREAPPSPPTTKRPRPASRCP